MKTSVNAYTQIMYSHPDLRRLGHRTHTNQGKSVCFEKGKVNNGKTEMEDKSKGGQSWPANLTLVLSKEE